MRHLQKTRSSERQPAQNRQTAKTPIQTRARHLLDLVLEATGNVYKWITGGVDGSYKMGQACVLLAPGSLSHDHCAALTLSSRYDRPCYGDWRA